MAGTRSGGRQTAAQRRTAKAAAEEATTSTIKGSITVDGTKYELGDLELGELSELEDHTGKTLDEISFGSAKVIAFVVWLVRRRGDPDYTLEQAGKIQIKRLGADKGEGDGPEVGDDPTPAAAASG